MSTNIVEIKTKNANKSSSEMSHKVPEDVAEIKNLLIKLLLNEYDSIMESSDTLEQKVNRLFTLTTGHQECGHISGVDDLAKLEEVLLYVSKIRSSGSYWVWKEGEKNQRLNYHVYELFLPYGLKATTEFVTLRQIGPKRCSEVKAVCTDQEKQQYEFVAPGLSPLSTNIFYFIIDLNGAEMKLHSWAPGMFTAPQYRPHGARDQTVRVGLHSRDGKVMTDVMRNMAISNIESSGQGKAESSE